jgi:hypothetical protein
MSSPPEPRLQSVLISARYPEADVNTILASYHPDTAALRRYLVNEKLLSRADGIYWRSGGWVDVDE